MHAEPSLGGARKRLGMLTPSSNTVLEPATVSLARGLDAFVSVHFARLRVTKIVLDAAAQAQFETNPILEAADLLADAKPDVIAWNGTSASWRGFAYEEALLAAIAERTGVPATSAIVGINTALARLGVRRLGLVTPYTRDVQERIIANYRSIGIDVVAEAHAGERDNFSFAEIDEGRVAEMCRTVAGSHPYAVAIVCTNMRGAHLAPALERELDLPVIDSIAATLRACLDLCGIATQPLLIAGRLFALPATMVSSVPRPVRSEEVAGDGRRG